jgi:hypothetical protein
MQPEVYSFIKRPENHYYEFNSVGPKGSIKKVVEYYRFHEFMKAHPDAILIATGSTLSRARLYQIAIVRKWNEINPIFEIKGYAEGAWKPFTSGGHFRAFLIKKK